MDLHTTTISRSWKHMNLFFISAVLFLGMVFFGTSHAQSSGSSAQPSKHIGIGIIVGEPTGVDLKWFLSEDNAVEFAAAWSLSGNNNLHLQGEYLFHNYGLITVEKGKLPLFFGVGGRLIFRENQDNILGIRIPVGLAYEFDAPFDVFVELVPILDLTPDTDFDLEAAIGGRFWF